MRHRTLAFLVPLGLIVATSSAQAQLGAPGPNPNATFVPGGANHGIPNDQLMNSVGLPGGAQVSMGAFNRCDGDLPWDGNGTYYAAPGQYNPLMGCVTAESPQYSTWNFQMYISDNNPADTYGLFYQLTPGGPFGEVILPVLNNPLFINGVFQDTWNLGMGFLSGNPFFANVIPRGGPFDYNAAGTYQFGLILTDPVGNPLGGQYLGAGVAVNVTPEPVTMVLLATGLLGVGIVARRRRTSVES